MNLFDYYLIQRDRDSLLMVRTVTCGALKVDCYGQLDPEGQIIATTQDAHGNTSEHCFQTPTGHLWTDWVQAVAHISQWASKHDLSVLALTSD